MKTDDDKCVLYIRLWWWWKRRRRRDYDDSSSACLNCWLLNFVLVRISRCSSLVVVLVVDRWWWCWRRRFFSSSSFSIICTVGLRFLLWFVVWKTERDKDLVREKEKEKRNCRKKEKKVCVCVVISQRVIGKERARWASSLSHSIIYIQKHEHLFLFSLTTFISKEKKIDKGKENRDTEGN